MVGKTGAEVVGAGAPAGDESQPETLYQIVKVEGSERWPQTYWTILTWDKGAWHAYTWNSYFSLEDAQATLARMLVEHRRYSLGRPSFRAIA
jgi:hypothetical protein